MADEFKCPNCGSDSVARSPYRWLWELRRLGVQCYVCKGWTVSDRVSTDLGINDDPDFYRQQISEQLTGKRQAKTYGLPESCPTCRRPY